MTRHERAHLIEVLHHVVIGDKMTAVRILRQVIKAADAEHAAENNVNTALETSSKEAPHGN